jgi:hypothetical protein
MVRGGETVKDDIGNGKEEGRKGWDCKMILYARAYTAVRMMEGD